MTLNVWVTKIYNYYLYIIMMGRKTALLVSLHFNEITFRMFTIVNEVEIVYSTLLVRNNNLLCDQDINTLCQYQLS